MILYNYDVTVSPPYLQVLHPQIWKANCKELEYLWISASEGHPRTDQSPVNTER